MCTENDSEFLAEILLIFSVSEWYDYIVTHKKKCYSIKNFPPISSKRLSIKNVSIKQPDN